MARTAGSSGRRSNLTKWFRDGGGWDGIDARIAPKQEDFIITKRCPSAFLRDGPLPLTDYLKADTVIINGWHDERLCPRQQLSIRCPMVSGQSYRGVRPGQVAWTAQGELFDMATKYARRELRLSLTT